MHTLVGACYISSYIHAQQLMVPMNRQAHLLVGMLCTYTHQSVTSLNKLKCPFVSSKHNYKENWNADKFIQVVIN